MIPPAALRLLLPLAIAFSVFLGCYDHPIAVRVRLGSLRVSTETGGSHWDGDGYLVLVEGPSVEAVGKEDVSTPSWEPRRPSLSISASRRRSKISRIKSPSYDAASSHVGSTTGVGEVAKDSR